MSQTALSPQPAGTTTFAETVGELVARYRP